MVYENNNIDLLESDELTKSKKINSEYFENDYVKIRTVGKGAFGVANLYRRISDSKMVVLKEVNMSELSANERQMALNEVEVLSVLHHPNIISYLGSFEKDGILIIEMEFAEGGTLSQYLTKCKSPLCELEIITLFKQIIEAIQHMHENNILHRDLKTANIFLTKEHLIKVGDFGISKVMDTKSQAQTVLGTPYYISPEMCEGKQYDKKSDMWALGCILYELACREKAFKGTSIPAIVNKIMKGSYEPLPSIYSKELRLLVCDLLQIEPADRPLTDEIFYRVSELEIKAKQTEKTCPSIKLSQKERSILYQLSGHGENFSLKPINLPPTIKINQVSVSVTHCIALTSDMLVYTWGDGVKGQLAHEDSPEWLSEPQLVENLVSKSINLVGAGRGFSVFVSESGMLFTCGDGSMGCLGHGDWNNLKIPQLVERLLNVDIVALSCGETHVMIMTKDKDLFCWGSLPLEHNSCIPQQLESIDNMIPKRIACGPDALAVITTCGKLFTCGINNNNRLGLNRDILGFTIKAVFQSDRLTLVQGLSKWIIKDLSIGKNHSVVLTKCGHVITMGDNTDSQLGHIFSSKPTLVDSINHYFVTKIACGPTYTVVGILENALYFWGTRFTQVVEKINKSTSSTHTMSILESQIVQEPQPILILHASDEQIKKGLIVKINAIYPLWHSIMILIDTTAPLAKVSLLNQSNAGQDSFQCDYDSLGPVPEWIKKELSQATDEWPGEPST